MSTTISLLALWSYPLEALQVSWRSASFSLQALKSEKIQTQGIAGNRLNLNKTFCSEKVLKLPILKAPLPRSHRPSPTASKDLASEADRRQQLASGWAVSWALPSDTRGIVLSSPTGASAWPLGTVASPDAWERTAQMAAVRSPSCTYTFLMRLAWRCLKTEADFAQTMFLCWMMTDSCHNTSAKLRNQTTWVENGALTQHTRQFNFTWKLRFKCSHTLFWFWITTKGLLAVKSWHIALYLFK